MRRALPIEPIILVAFFMALAASVVLSGCCCMARAPTKPCLATQGCPAPAPLPTCQTEVTGQAQPLAKLLARAPDLVGQEVTLRSRLLRGGGHCTLLLCGKGSCCNRCSDGYVFSTEAKADRAWPHTLFLRNTGPGPHPHPSLVCAGDDSLVCCPLATGMEVVATGRFAASGESIHGKLYSIESPRICLP